MMTDESVRSNRDMQTLKRKHKFVVSRKATSAFKAGFRDYFKDRDLGLREATGGEYMAEVHRACGPVPPGGGGTHLHRINFQFNYQLKGWCRVEIEGEGVFRFEEGDTWLQPSAIKHNFLDCSPDCEILEIVSPGNFETVEA